MAGSRGPVPKRSDQRRRKNKPAGPDVVEADGAAEVETPVASPEWHPVAVRWFESLALSGQSHFYEPSDWAAAYVLAESMSREMNPQPMTVGHGEHAFIEMVSLPPKGASLAAWLKGMSVLLVTEGDRRRVAMELTRPKSDEVPADVANFDEFRRRLESV
jgi:hypothetical protein